eukprot:403358358
MGITQEQLCFGSNESEDSKGKTIQMMFLENLSDKGTQILLGVGLFAMVYGLLNSKAEDYGWVEGFSIIATGLILMIITVIGDYKKEKQQNQLAKKASDEKIKVLRGEAGLEMSISISDLVVGDIIKLEAEMIVPVDSILVSGSNIKCDESAFTGECDLSDKTPLTESSYENNPNPFLWSKTKLENGSGLALVCAVGKNTNFGRLPELVPEDEEKEVLTPLHEKLNSLLKNIGKAAALFSTLVFIIMITKFIIVTLSKEDGNLLTKETLTELLTQFIFSMTISIMIFPEGIPLAVNLSIAKSVTQMSKQGNFIKNLAAQESMGEISELIADKTGTLTQNSMAVKEIYFNERIITGRPSNFKTLPNSDKFSEAVLYNSTTRVEKDQRGQLIAIDGNATDQGIFKYLMEVGFDTFSISRQRDQHILETIPFTSARKMTTVAIRHPTDDKVVRVYVKGAAEKVISACKYYYDKSGDRQELGQVQIDSILKNIVEDFGRKQLRTITIASVDMTVKEYESLKTANNNFQTNQDKKVLENNMTFVGIYGLCDPLRHETIETIRKCHQDGINVRMVTGDNLDTAKAIAIEAGIITQEEAEQEYVCMSGANFSETCGGLINVEDDNGDGSTKYEINDKIMFRIVQNKLKVLARATPDQKLMLVAGLQENHKIVGFIGDGTSDAPALKKADVGLCMGISTNVAKDASDIMLLTDNLNGILTGVKLSRNIIENIRRFLQFQITVNIVAMFIIIFGAIFMNDLPLDSIQMVWINLLLDTCAAIYFGNESAQENIIDKKPDQRNGSLINPLMWRNILGQTLFQASILITMLFAGKEFLGFDYDDNLQITYTVNEEEFTNQQKLEHYTMIFHTFMFMSIFNLINSRIIGDEYNVFRGIQTNLFLIFGIAATIAAQCLLVQYCGSLFRVTSLSQEYHLICFGIGSLTLIQGMIIKFIAPAKFFADKALQESCDTLIIRRL